MVRLNILIYKSCACPVTGVQNFEIREHLYALHCSIHVLQKGPWPLLARQSKLHLGWRHKKRGVGEEMRFLMNLIAVDCCQTTTNENLIYFTTNSCKLKKHLGNLKIPSLKSALLGKIHTLFQDVLLI